MTLTHRDTKEENAIYGPVERWGAERARDFSIPLPGEGLWDCAQARLPKHLSEIENISRRIEKQIAELHSMLDERNELFRATAVLSTLSAPIRKLPQDLLMYLVETVVFSREGRYGWTVDHIPQNIPCVLIQLSHICAAFREATLHCHRAWGTFSFDTTHAKPSKGMYHLIELHLRRSQNAPLNICLAVGNQYPRRPILEAASIMGHDIDMLLSSEATDQPTSPDTWENRILLKIFENCNRWERMTIWLSRPAFQVVLAALRVSPKPFPMLKHFAAMPPIPLISKDENLFHDFSCFFSGENAPSLEALHIPDFRMGGGFPVTNLQEASLDLHRVTDLRETDIVHFLFTAVNLQDLMLRMRVPTGNAPHNVGPLIHRKISSLDTDCITFYYICQFMDLELPSLGRLTLSHVEDAVQAANGDPIDIGPFPITSVFSRWGRGLHTLTLQHAARINSTLLDISASLSLLPNTTSVTYIEPSLASYQQDEDRDLMPYPFAVLAAAIMNARSLPSLTNLEVAVNAAYKRKDKLRVALAALIQAVDLRAKPLPGYAAKKLEAFELAFGTGSSVDCAVTELQWPRRLKELSTMGLDVRVYGKSSLLSLANDLLAQANPVFEQRNTIVSCMVLIASRSLTPPFPTAGPAFVI